MTEIGIAIVGVGSIADYHLGGLRAAGGAVVRAVAARSVESARAYALGRGVPEGVGDWRGLLDRPDIDALVVATPDETHREIAEAAAAAGKGVLVQKPMAPTSADCRAMIDAAARNGTVLEVSFMHRHFEECVRARAMIAEGALGRVLSLQLRNATPGPDWAAWFYAGDRVAGGVVAQLGVHGIDLLQAMAGPIAQVAAMATIARRERRLRDGVTVAPSNVDLAQALYRFRDGALATHEMSFNDGGGTDRFSLVIQGEDAMLELRGARGALALHAGDGWRVVDLPSPPPGARHHAAFLAILRGEAPGGASAAGGLSSMLVAEAIGRAAGSGIWVTPGQPGDEAR